ncbi:MAG: hypothetical protein AB7R89_15175 [Dehalococcoidia bacterium]
MPAFPSVEWFRAVADIVNNDPEYRKLGNCDAAVGIEVGDRTFELSFEGYEITDIKEINSAASEDLDFTLVMSPDHWRDMLLNIKEHGRAELQYTLNSIDLGNPEEFARSNDYYRRDLFYRYNQSFQHFFDASAKIDTQFAEPARR